MGACVSDGSRTFFNNSTAKAVVLKDCEVATVQCYPAWGRWDETQRHVYHLDDFSNKVREMKNQGLLVTAHMLMGWDQYFPNWYKNYDFPADTLDAILKSWIKSIIQYKGNDTLVDNWNVVNEAISWNGSGGYWPLYNADLKSACEMQRLGFEPDSSGLTGAQYVNASHPVYIRRSFEYARQYTNKKLELRDASIEFPTDSKYKAFYQLATHLKKVVAPVDVIGFQAHLNLEQQYDWDGFANNIRRYRQLGYQVYITEVDIGDPSKTWNADKADFQKMMYYRLVTASIRGGATEFHTWGINDDNNTGWRHGEKGLPFTNTYIAKPAYSGMKEALIDMSHILFWEMDAMPNDTMPDVMMYGNAGIPVNFGTPVFAAGFKNKALQFDGADDYLISKPLTDTISGNFTFSCFIKTNSTADAVIADIAKESNSGLRMGVNALGKVILTGDGLVTGLSSTEIVNDGQWHFTALQCKDNKIYLFLDSQVPVDSTTGLPEKYTRLVVGSANEGVLPFTGLIDEVKLYDTYIESASFTRNMVPFCPQKTSLTQKGMIMRVAWVDQSINEEGYLIERKTGTGNWEEIKTLGKVLFYSDTVKLYSTLYKYRVRAINRFGKSDPSMSVSATSPANPNTGLTENNARDQQKCLAYPNPFSESFTILNKEPASLKIYDAGGRLVFEKKEPVTQLEIAGKHFPAGVYFIKAAGRNIHFETRIFKK
jgi:GH35 family endo-1,4-beta-xylanase